MSNLNTAADAIFIKIGFIEINAVGVVAIAAVVVLAVVWAASSTWRRSRS